MKKNYKRLITPTVLLLILVFGLLYIFAERNTLKAGDKRTYEHPLGGNYELTIDRVEELVERNMYERDVTRVIAVTYTFKNVDYKGDQFLNVNQDNWKCYDKDGKELHIYDLGYAGKFINSAQAEQGESVTKTVIYGMDDDKNYIKLDTRDPDTDTGKSMVIKVLW